METSTRLFAIPTLCLFGSTFQAWRLGNEKRDVLLLSMWKTRGQLAVAEST